MDDIGLGEALASMLKFALLALLVVPSWLILTIQFIRHDLRAKREGLKWASRTHVAVAWTHWILSLLLFLTMVGSLVAIPFLVASIGMRGVHRWGWILAIVLHSGLALTWGFALVHAGTTGNGSVDVWIIGPLLLLLHGTAILFSKARLRELPMWSAQQGREFPSAGPA